MRDFMIFGLRLAGRTLRHHTGFSAAVVVMLGLTIGATTLVIGVAHGVLMRPLPFPDPDRIVTVWNTTEPERTAANPLSRNELLELAGAKAPSLTAFAGFSHENLNVSHGSDTERVRGAVVMGGFFEVFGVAAAQGRTLLPEDDQPGRDDAVVLSDTLFRRAFSGDPAIVGRAVRVNGRSRTVVGVMPPGFLPPSNAQLWIPMALDSARLDAGTARSHGHGAVARLAPGQSLGSAGAALSAVERRLRARYPDSIPETSAIRVDTFQEYLVGSVRAPLATLVLTATLMLLIGIVNVAGLFLNRGLSRQREAAVRAALGASRGRLALERGLEGLILALAGGALGLLLAELGRRALPAFVSLPSAPALLPRLSEVAPAGLLPSLDTLFVAVLATLLACVLSLTPSMFGHGLTLMDPLRARAGGLRSGRLRRLLVAVEIALAIVLFVGAGLALRGFARLSGSPAGLAAEGLVVGRISLPQASYPGAAQVTSFVETVRERLAAKPGVLFVGAVSELPLSRDQPSNWTLDIEGQPREPKEPLVNYTLTAGDYLRALGVEVRRGSLPGSQEGVCVINETLARLKFPNVDPVGQRVRLFGDSQWFTVRGVVGDIANGGLGVAAKPEVFLPYVEIRTGSPYIPRQMTIVGRFGAEQGANALGVFGAALRQEVRALSTEVPVDRVDTMDSVLAGSIGRYRVTASLLVWFGALAAALVATGLYGVVSHWVKEREREFGVRVALGAKGVGILSLVLRETLQLVAIGIGAGLLCAFLLTRLACAELFGIPPADAATFAAAPFAFLIVSLLAALAPTRRALRVDPVEILRPE